MGLNPQAPPASLSPPYIGHRPQGGWITYRGTVRVPRRTKMDFKKKKKKIEHSARLRYT
jgi:hypothetical protein